MTAHVKDAGVWKPLNEIYVKDAGVWKPTKRGYVKDAGVWKPYTKSFEKQYASISGSVTHTFIIEDSSPNNIVLLILQYSSAFDTNHISNINPYDSDNKFISYDDHIYGTESQYYMTEMYYWNGDVKEIEFYTNSHTWANLVVVPDAVDLDFLASTDFGNQSQTHFSFDLNNITHSSNYIFVAAVSTHSSFTEVYNVSLENNSNPVSSELKDIHGGYNIYHEPIEGLDSGDFSFSYQVLTPEDTSADVNSMVMAVVGY